MPDGKKFDAELPERELGKKSKYLRIKSARSVSSRKIRSELVKVSKVKYPIFYLKRVKVANKIPM